MSDNRIQASFNSGEFAPTLFARVDLAKYRSAAALLENWFVDYRGGASTRPGTKYILQCGKSDSAVRLISFQAAFDVGYVMEFGDQYIRFFLDGAPVLETGLNITNIVNNAGNARITVNNTYNPGDWFRVSDVVGSTQLNGNYYIVASANATDILTFTDLFGNLITFASLSAYISGGTVERVYTIPSPYLAADLALIKFAQNVNRMVLCHPDYSPHELTTIAANNWTLLPIVFGSSVTNPTGVAVGTTLAAGTVNYSYIVTAVDINGQESAGGTIATLLNHTDIRSVAGTNTITWNAVSGAVSYNVYRAQLSYGAAVPLGSSHGFIGNVTGTGLADTNIVPDFSLTPQIGRNPFAGTGLASVTVTNAGTYTTVPSVTAAAPPSGGTALLNAVLQVQSITLPGIGTGTVTAGDLMVGPNGIVLVAATTAAGFAATFQPLTYPGSNRGSILSGSTPANPFQVVGPTGTTFINATWGVGLVTIIQQGSGYLSAPAITFGSGAATATSALLASVGSNPSVPGFFQQRLVLAAPANLPQTFYMSQPGEGRYYNYNVSNPVLPDDSITGTLVSGKLNTIKSMVPQTAGLLMFTDNASWLVNGGNGPGSGVSPASTVGNAQSFNGISDVPPIIVNFDVLYVQAKGSVIRDSAYNIYQNVFTGTDISLLSSHLFYTYSVLEWGLAEEPFKLIQAIRNDGTLLTLTFLKEQEFVGWTHSVTNGDFKSVCTVTETVSNFNTVDATYVVVERVINGQTVKYIERFADRQFPSGVEDAWCVDCGLGYNGAPATTFSGGQHLVGQTVTGLADGVIIDPFVMPSTGTFTLAAPASKVVVGEGFICDLQTLPLELGEPTVQGKVKKIPSVDVRVADTLGLKIGSSFTSLTPMKDLVRGNVSSMFTGQPIQRVTDLVSGDARTILDPTYTVPGQYCIRQDLPYPATVLGVIPSVVIGDTPPGRGK